MGPDNLSGLERIPRVSTVPWKFTCDGLTDRQTHRGTIMLICTSLQDKNHIMQPKRNKRISRSGAARRNESMPRQSLKPRQYAAAIGLLQLLVVVIIADMDTNQYLGANPRTRDR
ncbi:hypothetical protein DPMN_026875 [Dreissena polymorpha]|uniref:Uncharacterized protein n=1 Tax=Dreissena polymorpha TaxID=45954 RepID=A0A9D4LS33_DREPO|nr:hypothetical protein DPMN_026875 [Dreissena polymorpha]